MRRQTLTPTLSFLVIAFSAAIIDAQSIAQYPGEGNYSITPLWVTATAGKDHIRFTSLGVGQRIRLEILNQAADRIVDSGMREGSLLDWKMDGYGNPLPDDIYGCLVTVEDRTGQLNHRRGVFRLTDGVARFETSQGDSLDMAASSEEQETMTILRDDEELPMIQLLHDGESGRIVSGKGGLSFGIGNAYAGKDVEYVRLTADGNLGIGVAEPQAKLDVGGYIRAQGIIFPDGRLQSTASSGSVFNVGQDSDGFGLKLDENNTMVAKRASSDGKSGNKQVLQSDGVSRVYGTEGEYNTFYGLNAGNGTMTGIENSFFGVNAGRADTSGLDNSFFGSFAGGSNTTGSGNAFFGMNAGSGNTTGGSNSFFGTAAGDSNTTGNFNSFYGNGAGVSNTEGRYNSFFGDRVGYSNFAGHNNSFFGEEAGYSNTTGYVNSFFGTSAGFSTTTGYSNSFFGAGAGQDNTTGSNNSYIGAFSDGAPGIDNATAIGYCAQVTKSNSLVLGSINGINKGAADTNVGIGTTAPLARLHVQNGNIYVGSAGQGMILKSPDGTRCAKLSIDNSVNLVTTPQACPESSATPAQVLYAAQFANGDGVISEVILCNPSTTEEVSGRASFYDNDGQPMTVGISGSSSRSSMDFLLPPLGMFTFSTDGLGKLNSGSLQVSSDNSVAGFVRFNLPGIGVAGVGSSQPLNTFIAPVRGKMGSIYSGIAVQNIENSPVTVNLSLRDRSGTVIPNGTKTVPDLAGLGHFAKFIHELFPQAALDDFEGSLTVEVSGGRIAATALELGSTAGQFTTLPVAPLN
jgi:hypothetical protein